MLSRTRTVAIVATVVMVSTMPARAEIACPPAAQGHTLTRMSLFIGDPENLAGMVPATPPAPNGFIYDWHLRDSTGLVAVCRYEGDVNLEIRLPPGLHECRVDHTSVKTTALCW